MLRLPPFEYLAPHSLDEAVAMLQQHGPEAMLVAGGTDLYPNMKRRLFTPKVLVGLRRIRDFRILAAKDDMIIGAGKTLTEVSHDPLIVQRYPALAVAAGLVSTPQLRNMGTIGGNLCLDTRCTYYNQSEPWREALGYCLKKDGQVCWVAPGSPRCWAVNSSDTAPVLVALGASVRLVGPAGARVIPVQALFHNDGIAYLTKAPDEIVAEIYLPPADGIKMVYKKLRRRGAFDFPILGVAAALRQAEDGTVTQASLVLGAVASYPLRASEAEQILVGQKLSDEVIEAAAKAAFKPAKPLDNTDMGHPYRKHMVQVYVARALQEIRAN